VLELLASLLLVEINDLCIIDFSDIGKPVDYEYSEESSVGYIVVFNADGLEIEQCFQLGDLDEAVNVVVSELELPQPLKFLKFSQVRMVDN